MKKGLSGMTPMHCACVNPDTGPLKAMFAVCPDFNMADSDQWKLVHYASVCQGLEPLKYMQYFCGAKKASVLNLFVFYQVPGG